VDEQEIRSSIAKDILDFKSTISESFSVSETEIHHGEQLLRQWAIYIIDRCYEIVNKP
jgi:hypothetical protein